MSQAVAAGGTGRPVATAASDGDTRVSAHRVAQRSATRPRPAADASGALTSWALTCSAESARSGVSELPELKTSGKPNAEERADTLVAAHVPAGPPPASDSAAGGIDRKGEGGSRRTAGRAGTGLLSVPAGTSLPLPLPLPPLLHVHVAHCVPLCAAVEIVAGRAGGSERPRP